MHPLRVGITKNVVEKSIIVGAVACPAREIIGSFAGQASLTPTVVGCSKKLTRIRAYYRKVRIYAYRVRLGESFKLVTQEI